MSFLKRLVLPVLAAVAVLAGCSSGVKTLVYNGKQPLQKPQTQPQGPIFVPNVPNQNLPLQANTPIVLPVQTEK